MIEWLEICEAMKNKLNRDLNREEERFLKWLCDEQDKESTKIKQTIN